MAPRPWLWASARWWGQAPCTAATCCSLPGYVQRLLPLPRSTRPRPPPARFAASARLGPLAAGGCSGSQSAQAARDQPMNEDGGGPGGTGGAGASQPAVPSQVPKPGLPEARPLRLLAAAALAPAPAPGCAGLVARGRHRAAAWRRPRALLVP